MPASVCGVTERSMSEVVAHLAEVIEIHTPDGEHFRVDLHERIRELEEQLEEALRQVAHYKSVVKLMCEKFA